MAGIAIQASAATLIDSWRAADLRALSNGDAVGSWTSAGNRTVTATVGYQPTLTKNATPAGGEAVHFNRDWLRMSANSPVAGLTAFSIALVFRADEPGAGDNWQWYGKTGLVDAEQGGVTRDWGTVIDENGLVGLGVGNPDMTVYSWSVPSVVDGNFHVAVFTWGDGMQCVSVDGYTTDCMSSPASTPRNDAGLSFGAIHTGENGSIRRFIGDIVEARFYDDALDWNEFTNVVQELTELHLAPGRPIIQLFSASTNRILIGSPVTLSWETKNLTGLWLEGIGPLTNSNGSLQVFPRTNTTYSLIASNDLGIRTAQLDVLVDQGIPVATSQSIHTLMNAPAKIELSGTDPQGSNLSFVLVSNPKHGTLQGAPPHLSYKPETNFIGADQFSFKVNDGEFDSPPATVTILVEALPAAPTEIRLSTTNISESAGPGSFIAGLRAIDVNPGDTHTFSLVPGFSDNSKFLVNSNALIASSFFVGGLGQTFSIRIRATDNTGLWVEQTLTLKVTNASQGVVINEVHYNPADNTLQEEFVELYNSTSADVDLSLWRLTGGIDLTIPQGTILKLGDFIVLSEDPPTLHSRYGVDALGPWQGGLSSDGETIRLLDANGKKVNEVTYKSEFPWPVGADGTGGSMSLVNPGLDNTLGSSWRTENPPSPGKTNGVFSLNAPPNIRQVSHSPQSPTSTNSIAITAKVTSAVGVSSVQLQYQIVSPGNYLPAVIPVSISQLINDPSLQPTPNPAFEASANWLTLPMLDNGLEGDAQAGDDIYTGVLPPQLNRVLVRYRIVVTDSLGSSRRAPFEDDPSLNFACFVYNGVPSYQGFSTQVLSALPVYCLISRATDISECSAYDGAYQLPQFDNNGLAHLARFAFNWPGTMVYDGVVYDHIRYRLHGANGRYQPGKRNWRFEFNRGHYLASRKQDGTPFGRKWTHLTTGKGSNNRLALTFGLNEAINYFLWNKVGVPAPETFFFHFRVLDGPVEAVDAFNNDFWGLNWAQEDYDVRFLDSHNLPKGNLYKLINAAMSFDAGLDMLGQQRYQAPNAVTNGSDGAAIQAGLLASQSSDWIRAHVNCNEWFHYHAVCEAVRNYDFWPDANKNAAWFFAPPYDSTNDYHGRFWTLPWDTDCTWGPTWNSGQDLVYNGVFLAASHPDLRIEYANTIREVRDLLFQPDQINPLIDSFAAQIEKFVPADLRRWSNAPSGGDYVSLSSQAGFVSPALSGGLSAYVKDMKDFMFEGGNHAWWLDRQAVSPGGWITRLDTLSSDSATPSRPTITYTGPAGFPVTSLLFRSSAFADAQGTNTFGAMQWRLAEITPAHVAATNPAGLKMEWDAVWDSGRQTPFTNQIQFPAVAAVPGHTYRARVRHQDNTGRWSSWSAPVEFTPSAVDTISELKNSLVISEIMYNPPAANSLDGAEFEFIELKNIGTNSLALGGLFFSSGITFTFTNGTSLDPNHYFLLGRNAAALQSKYPGIVVNGIYSGKLDNSGETITLTHPYGIDILSVKYGNGAPWPVAADGYGFSLVFDPDNPQHYRASSKTGGSPGTPDPASTIPTVVINEVLSSPQPPARDAIELYNPTPTNANIGGWFLTDDAAYPWKFRIPDGTWISANNYLVLDETQFNSTPGIGTSFSLSSLGEEVYLFSADDAHNLTGYSHGFEFGGTHMGESFGRYINSVGEEQFPPQLATSLGTNNLGPRVGPVVFSEINCAPTNSGLAFLELRNITSTSIVLNDSNQTNSTWKVGGLGFTFPSGISLPPGGFLLLVASDPAAFRVAYKIPSEVAILQYTGQLQTNGETLELLCPEEHGTNGVAWNCVDQVRYGTTPPWPSVCANGLSLQRIDPFCYGNDPINWEASSPNPGTAKETRAPDIRLQWQRETGSSEIRFSFLAEANRFYQLEFKDALPDQNWATLVSIPVLPTNRVASINDSVHAAHRFYRISTLGIGSEK